MTTLDTRRFARMLGLRNPATVARQVLARAKRRVRDTLRGETDATFFDVLDWPAVNRLLAPFGVPSFHADPAQAATDTPGAIRFILGTLAASSRLRRRFPTALTDGPSGAFCAWLTSDTRLSPAAIANLRAAFASHPGDRVRRVFDVRPDLRDAFPLGLTPHPDRALYLVWLVGHGAEAFGITAEEAIWFFVETDEIPDRGLAATFLVQPSWQAAVPHGLTPFGWPTLKAYLAQRYGAAGRWFTRAKLPKTYRSWEDVELLKQAKPNLAVPTDRAAVTDWLRQQAELPTPSAEWFRDYRADAPTAGVNVLAHFRYPSGLQEAAVGIATAVQRTGGRTLLRDLPVRFDTDWTDRTRYHGVELYDTTVYVAALNSFPDVWATRAGLHLRPGVKRIALWYWELEEVPADYVPKLGWPTEVWAPTRFIADTFRKYVTVPVVPMLPGVELPAFTPKPRSYFGLPDNRFLVLFTFDMGSVMARKNPLGLIAAYKKAFRADDRVHLAIKVSRGETDPKNLAILKAAAAEAGVTIINTVYSRSDALALLNACDCYASLHRSEGLGLGLAETMLMGKPVVATDYSGNLDFMTPTTGYLIDYQRVPIVDDIPPYPKGCIWADPSIEHAAITLRHIFSHRDEAAAVGARAKAKLTDLLSMDAYGQRIRARLQ